jgi:catechol 2,3-dioxygenase-like lactoylglutathione lyase family enzyme
MINAIQHIGLGVTNRDKAFAFYRDALGFSVKIAENSGGCPGVGPIINNDETRDVVIAMNPYGGGLVELFQYTSRAPKPIPKKVDFSYNGYLFYGLKVGNADKALELIERHGGERVGDPSDFTPMRDLRWRTAMFKDPEGIHGILLEYPGNNVGNGTHKPRIGGVEYVAIGVSNIDASVDFYSRVLGYDDVVYRIEGRAPEWEGAFGKGSGMRRALLKKSKKAGGPFRHFLKGGMIELIEVDGNCGKNNYEGRTWGDIGLMELTFDVNDIEACYENARGAGATLAAPPYKDDIGMNTHATFAYIWDPDGSLLEFAEISSLPVPYFVIRLAVNPFVVGTAKRLGLMK